MNSKLAISIFILVDLNRYSFGSSTLVIADHRASRSTSMSLFAARSIRHIIVEVKSCVLIDRDLHIGNGEMIAAITCNLWVVARVCRSLALYAF